MTLYSSFDICHSPRKDVALKGIHVNPSNDFNLQFLFMLASFVADVPKAKICWVLNVAQEYIHRVIQRLAKREEFSGCASSKKRIVAHMLKVFETFCIYVDKILAKKKPLKLLFVRNTFWIKLIFIS